MIDSLMKRAKAKLRRMIYRDSYDQVVSRYVAQFGDRVLCGPFSGMKLLREYDRRHSAYLPKLIGSYEAELHPAIYATALRRPALVVNIGAADGYYTVGYALFINSQVIAFEMSETLTDQCQRVAEMNHVGHLISYEGECDSSKLRTVIQPNALIVADCEGCEDTVLDSNIEGLNSSQLIIETHDHIVPGVTNRLIERFRNTHEVFRFVSRERSESDYPILLSMRKRDRETALNEFRHATSYWLYLVPYVTGIPSL